MKKKYLITLSKELDSKFKHHRDICGPEAIIFLAGKNSDGIFVDAVPLRKEAGCAYMPGVGTRQLTRAYLKLSKKKLIAGAIIRITTRYTARQTGSEETTNISRFNIPFVVYGEGRTRCAKYYGKKHTHTGYCSCQRCQASIILERINVKAV